MASSNIRRLQLYKRDKPRSFALVNDDWVLCFQSDKNDKHRSIAEFVSLPEFDASAFKSVKLQQVFGCLGLISLHEHVFLGVVTGCAKVAQIRENESVQRIHAVEFYCLDSDIFDSRLVDISGNYVNDEHDLYETTERPSVFEDPCLDLQRLLGTGTFYYSGDHDLSMSLQPRLREDYDPEAFDRQFLWNDYLIASLSAMRSNMTPSRKAALDQGRFLTSIIRGYAETLQVQLGSGTPAQLTIISRLSSKRAGTRFNARGIDDDGNVANFVETETIVHTKLWTSSFVQVRGSVPLFWEQITSGFMGQHKVEVTRSPSATQAAFEKHFTAMLEKYGGAVHIVNLLGSATGEANLTALYQDAVRSSGFGNAVRSTEFDFHHEVKNGYEGAATIKPLLRNSAAHYGFFMYTAQGQQTSTQSGIFRTNCLDCLDRTNMIQNIISQANLESLLRTVGIYPVSTLWDQHGTLWADNGDALSHIYAGTGALKTSFTRKGKMSIAGALADATKSAARLYINNFQDKGKQEVIDVMLGRLVNQKSVILFDPIADWVNTEAHKREAEWSSRQTLNVFAGTYNLNGREGDEPLDPWLRPSSLSCEPDIYAIGFQEIVELTPSQIVSADPVKVKEWSDRVLKCLDPKQNDKYVLLRTGQLVGAALLLFVKRKCLKEIKMVEGATKKTGFKGMSGNKGGVAIRLDYGATRICFLNAHFAAGQNNHVERNQDFATILGGIKFQRGRNIADHHDAVYWIGDFNYRINLAAEEVKQHIEAQDWGALYSADQLNLQMIKGNVFSYFQEKEISFAPTYKFDNGTDDYDTSEKHRIPAWTDRIMKKGPMVRQILYDSAPNLRLSDHKPVYATYEMDVRLVDDSKKSAIEKELYATRRAAIAERADLSKEDIESILGKDLPPASTDRSKWWLDHHANARSDLKTPPGSRLNPDRPINPWQSGQAAFVDKRPPVPARRNGTSDSLPPALPRRTLSIQTANSIPPALPERTRTDSSRPSSSASTRKENGPVAPKPPSPRRSAVVPTDQGAAEASIKAQVEHDVDHLNDNISEASDLSGYKSLV